MLLGNREHARDPVGSEQTLKEFRLFRDSNDYLYDIGERKRKEAEISVCKVFAKKPAWVSGGHIALQFRASSLRGHPAAFESPSRGGRISKMQYRENSPPYKSSISRRVRH